MDEAFKQDLRTLLREELRDVRGDIRALRGDVLRLGKEIAEIRQDVVNVETKLDDLIETVRSAGVPI